jgi:oligopeptide transport system substrate-binding protein
VEKYGTSWTNLTNIVSNGPYQLAEICPQSHIKLVKNPKYWDKDQVKVDTVYYWVHQNPETELDKFRTGKLHVTWTIPFTKLSWVRKNMPEALRITPFLALTYYAINMKRELLGQSPTLRKALNMAVNRSALVQKVRGLEEAPAYSWVPTQTANYKAVEADWAKMSQEDRETKARELYQAAGFNDQNPLEIELLCDTDENNRRVATAVASMWQHVLGAKVRVRIEGAKLFFASRAKREFDLIQAHWIGDFNDPETFLSLFRSDIGAQNLTSFDNPRFMETLKLALNEANPDKRQGLMQQVEQIILTELPVILMYFDTQFQLVSPKLQGWQDNILGNHRSKHLSLQK